MTVGTGTRLPSTPEELIAAQERLAALTPPGWQPPDAPYAAGACDVIFGRHLRGPGRRGDPAWAAAAVLRARRRAGEATVRGRAGAPYAPGLLFLREGELLVAAVRALPCRPDVLLVNATGRDHPRRAGLALHLGVALDIPSVGVTDRPLLARGDPPADHQGARTPLHLGDAVVGHWLRARRGARPLAVHAAWRTDPDTAVEVVLAVSGSFRTPIPLREARRLAREARAA